MVSTIIITSTLVVLVFAAVAVAQQVLKSYWPQNDLMVGREFMVQVSNSLDNVAWNPGRSEPVPYTTHVGHIIFFPNTITYNITLTYINNNTKSFFYTSGIFLYRLPLHYYTMSDGYFERLPVNITDPSYRNDTEPRDLPVGVGPNATANRVFLVKESTGTETNYIIFAVVPRFRLINSTITLVNKTTVYYRLYIANLTLGTVAATQRAITLQGTGLEITPYNGVKNMTVEVDFPRISQGFYNVFFHFSKTLQVDIPFPSNGVVVEVYIGEVTLSYG